MASDKTVVIEYLFFSNWDSASQTLRTALIDQDEVVRAIRYCNVRDNRGRSTNNPANFMKDIVRNANASSVWPQAVAALRYTAIQRTGNRGVFEFIPYAPAQTEPFPDIYKFRAGVPVFAVQSLSMLAESKMLGRQDESWLVQTAARLAIVETHLALTSPLRGSVVDVIHLQNQMKLHNTEMDAVYMVRLRDPQGNLVTGAITVEAKGEGERVLENQLVAQAKAAFGQAKFQYAIPIALRTVTGRGVYVAEFGKVDVVAADLYSAPVLVSEALYELTPPVPGI